MNYYLRSVVVARLYKNVYKFNGKMGVYNKFTTKERL